MNDPLGDLTALQQCATTRLTAHRHTTLPDTPGIRRAAVALCIVEHAGTPSMIVIKRAHRGRNAGQWALPGGRLEDGESPQQAALRELHEEIGLTAAPDAVLGRLDDFPAASNFTITPIVIALTDPGSPTPNADEVHSVHHVPLRRLAAPDTVQWIPRQDGRRLLQMRLGPRMVIHAPTGALLWQFREIVLLGRTARVADFLQPEWTHR